MTNLCKTRKNIHVLDAHPLANWYNFTLDFGNIIPKIKTLVCNKLPSEYNFNQPSSFPIQIINCIFFSSHNTKPKTERKTSVYSFIYSKCRTHIYIWSNSKFSTFTVHKSSSNWTHNRRKCYTTVQCTKIMKTNPSYTTANTLAYYFMWEILLAIIMPHFGNIYISKA